MAASLPQRPADTSDANISDSATTPDPEILDTEPMVRNFGSLGPMVAKLYALFLQNEEDLSHTLRDRLNGGDLQGARMAAHAAAGAARTAGARKVACLCSAIEEAILRGDAEEARVDAAGLDSALADVRSMIARI